jgi:adenylylsulfate kinase
MKVKGLWLFGLSGAGKTFLSKLIYKKLEKAFLIDGDYVRKNVSTDLSFSKKDRTIQCERLIGIANIALKNQCFPIVTSAYLTKKNNAKLDKKKIIVIKIVRKKKYVLKKSTYKLNKKNIVGKDILYEKFKYQKFYNNKNYKKNIDKLLKKLKLIF